MTPFESVAEELLAKGWGPLPLPPSAKKPPPEGFTGRIGGEVTVEQVRAWIRERRYAVGRGLLEVGNVAVPAPVGVVGVDVDDYRDRGGAQTWAALSATAAGSFPDTFVVTAREPSASVSGIRWYRLPESVDESGLWGAHEGVELVRSGHRYAVVPPSVHPDLGGAVYRVFDEATGRECEFPAVDELPELSEAQGRLLTKAGAPWSRLPRDPEAPDQQDLCPAVAAALQDAVEAVEGSSRHDAVNALVLRMVRLEGQGHRGVHHSLTELENAFVEAVGDRSSAAEATGEFERMVTGAEAMVAADPTPAGDRRCCGTEAGEFDAAVTKRIFDMRVTAEARRQYEQSQHPERPVPPPVMGDCLTTEDTTPRWRVDGLIPLGGRVTVIAPAKAGKTTILTELVRCLADGRPFLGRLDVQPVIGRIAYLNMELAADMFARWLLRGATTTLDNVAVFNLRGEPNPFTTTSGVEHLTEQLAGLKAEVLVVDPLSRAFNGKDPDKAGDMMTFLALLDEIAHNAGISEIVTAVHAGRDRGRSRGSTALDDWPDTLITLRHEAGARSIQAAGRDVDFPEETYTLTDDHTLQLTGSNPAQGRQEAAQQAVLETVAAQPGITVNQLLAALRDRVSAKDIQAAREHLLERGALTVEPGPNRSQRHHLAADGGAAAGVPQ